MDPAESIQIEALYPLRSAHAGELNEQQENFVVEATWGPGCSSEYVCPASGLIQPQRNVATASREILVRARAQVSGQLISSMIQMITIVYTLIECPLGLDNQAFVWFIDLSIRALRLASYHARVADSFYRRSMFRTGAESDSLTPDYSVYTSGRCHESVPQV